MTRVDVAKEVLDRFRSTDASVDGETLTIRFPLWQIVSISAVVTAAAGSVLFGVWLTTRDLGAVVERLNGSVQANTDTIERLHDGVDRLRISQAKVEEFVDGQKRKR